MKKIYFGLALALACNMSLISQTLEVELTPSLDNTMFRDVNLSNGMGEYIFTGITNKDVTRRALVKFDLAGAVPEGVTVDSAVLILKTIKIKPASTTVKIHRLTTAWGEGVSRASDGDGKGAPATEGDATWSYAIFESDPWIKKGGDYVLDFTAESTVSAGVDAVFRSDQLTLDVNGWLQDTATNNGWILIGDELNQATSVKFASRDHNENPLWPRLKLYYLGTGAENGLQNPELSMRVYQGPGMSTIRISNTGRPQLGTLAIYSITGSRVYFHNVALAQGDNTIVTTIGEPGIYIYKFTGTGIHESGKLIIQNR